MRGASAGHGSAADAAGRVYLDVPYAEKDTAKRLGARWDPAARRWYAPAGAGDDFAPWMPLPAVLPGEDRRFGAGLFVDLVPASCWFTNVRSCVPARDWDRLRHLVCGDRSGYRCEACGGSADRERGVWLEAHERWAYDDDTLTQHLRRLVCLCTRCHQATHFGYAQATGQSGAAFTHLCVVNRWQPNETDAHIGAAFRVWQDRSARDWSLDCSMLTAVGIIATPPPAPAQRRTVAEDTLAHHPTSR